jgi:hypothetical protein
MMTFIYSLGAVLFLSDFIRQPKIPVRKMRKSDQDAKQLAINRGCIEEVIERSRLKSCGCLNQVFAVQVYY